MQVSRLGKTATAIGVTALPAGLPALIVCPNHLRSQWARELKRFLPNSEPLILKGMKTEQGLPGASHYITNYHCIAAWADELHARGIRTVVFDEGHELRHPDTGKYDACYRISESATRAVSLTATPIINLGAEIFAVVDVIRPGALGTRDEFLREWCVGGQVVQDPAMLGQFLRRNGIMLRRTRRDVGRELEPVNRVVITVDADLDTLKRMEDVAAQLAQRSLLGGFQDAGAAAREFDMKLREATGAAKAKAVAEVVKGLLASESKLVLFGWHHEVYAIWREALKEYPVVFYTGSESAAEKDRAYRSFVEGGARVFVMSLRSGAGLDGLQHVSSTCVFGELDWSPSFHAQCVGRVARDGQKDVVNAVYVVVNDGSDPPMMELLGVKKDQRDGIADMATGEGAEVPRGRLLAAAEDFLKKRKLGMFAPAGKGSKDVQAIAKAVAAVDLPAGKESALQAVLGPALEKAAKRLGKTYAAEVVLSPESRIDFVVGRVGIECKVKGERTEVYRQVQRYLEHAELDALVLVCPWPLEDMTINNKHVRVVCTSHQGLM